MAYKENRKLKVYEKSSERRGTGFYVRYETVSLPQIRLEGHWLQELGFDPGTPINVKCESGKLVITALTE